LADLPGQQSAAERAIGEHGQPMLLGVRQHVFFNITLEEIVGSLNRGERRPLPETFHLIRRKIADADCANFPLVAKGVEGLGRLLEGDGIIGPVHLVYVDHVGL